MKTIGRKVLSLLFALALVATMYTPAFSLYETSDVNFEGTISQADLSDMTLQEVRGLNYTAAELQDQIDTAKATKDRLSTYTTLDEKLETLTLYDIDTITAIIETNHLNTAQANNLINSWHTGTQGTNDGDPQYRQILHAKYPDNSQSIQSRAFSGSIYNEPKSTDHTGVHYQVKSNTGGYNKASGTFTLPDVYLKSSLDDPDVPYGFFGIYIGYDLGMDLGVFYKQKDNTWRFFISGYAVSADGGEASYYEESTKTFSPSELSKVNLVASIIKGSNYDLLKLSFTDATSWELIDTLEVHTNNDATNEKQEPKAGPNKSLVSSNYSNVTFHREVTLAHSMQSMRDFTGSSIENAKWSDVYLYTTADYFKWQPTHTIAAKKIGETTKYCNTVHVSITNKWYEDVTDIYYED